MKSLQEREPRARKEPLDHTSLIITIDGSTTAGKRVLAEKLAERYDLTVFDTGTSIRALSLLAIENNLVKTDETNITTVPSDFSERLTRLMDTMPQKLTVTKPRKDERTARVMVGNRDMRGELLAFRKQKAIENLSAIIAASPDVRKKLYGFWRDAVAYLGGTVVIGRKTGVDLFPKAPIKLYFFASPDASAAYRVKHDPTASLRKTTEEQYVRERDAWERGIGLLTRPPGALVVDTSEYITRDRKGLGVLADKIAAHIDSKYDIK